MKWLLGTPSILVLALLLLIEGFAVRSASAQDLPDPNPRRNPDGTFTWWVGNNTQFPIIQAVLDAALPGDEVVVMPGQYVEDLLIETGDLSLRPACMDASGQAVWGELVLWNPTEGFEDDPWCVRVIGGNPADVNGDGVVNGADLAAVLGAWD